MKNQKILLLAEDSELRAELLQRGCELGAATFVGMITFPTMMGLMQNFVWKAMRVTANRRMAPVCGAVSLAVAASCSAAGFVTVEKRLNGTDKAMFVGSTKQETIFNVCSYAVFSFVTFKLFGGRFKNLCPSHTLHPGSFSVKGISLPYATARVTKKHQAEIQILGEKYGCHTCGKRYIWIESLIGKARKRIFGATSRVRVLYFADHNPPVALSEQYLKEGKKIVGKLYPQCKSCSYFQASQVRLQQANLLKSGDGIVTHATRIRMFKLWLPFPILFYYGVPQNLFEYLVGHL